MKEVVAKLLKNNTKKPRASQYSVSLSIELFDANNETQ